MTNTSNLRIVRTLRCKNSSTPGTLRKLTTAIGEAGADIGNLETVHMGYHFTVRDIDIYMENEQ